MYFVRPSQIPSFFVVTQTEIYFEELRYLLSPLFQYKQGNCHNLVHYASLILDSYGVEHKKIWIYAPCRYDEVSKKSIKLPDPNNLSPSGLLSWGYHVAIFVEFNGLAYVFDYFIDDEKPLSVGNWIEKMAVKNFKVEIESAEKYLFFTKPSETKKNGLFNGKYFEYEGLCKEQNWVAKGLAINKTAIRFFKNELYHFQFKTPLSHDYRLLAGSVNNFECVFRDNSFNKKMTPKFQEKHKGIIAEYRKIYEENLEKWIYKVENLL